MTIRESVKLHLHLILHEHLHKCENCNLSVYYLTRKFCLQRKFSSWPILNSLLLTSYILLSCNVHLTLVSIVWFTESNLKVNFVFFKLFSCSFFRLDKLERLLHQSYTWLLGSQEPFNTWQA